MFWYVLYNYVIERQYFYSLVCYSLALTPSNSKTVFWLLQIYNYEGVWRLLGFDIVKHYCLTGPSSRIGARAVYLFGILCFICIFFWYSSLEKLTINLFFLLLFLICVSAPNKSTKCSRPVLHFLHIKYYWK